MTASAANHARFSVAPMMDWTDRHCRYFHRQLTRCALLYTEMVTAAAVVHGDPERLLANDPAIGPVALQLGGSDPKELARACQIANGFGYSEINLNVGCPSDRVQSGRFGACLMAEPDLVADCVAAMAQASAVEVTVKCRIGIDDQDIETGLDNFIDTVAATGCNRFIIHARKAWLQGLSPKQNRDIPELDYNRVRHLKQRRPDLHISLNGGLTDLETATAHLEWADGIMLGRAAYHTPQILLDVDRIVFGQAAASDLPTVISTMADYTDRQAALGVRPNAILRHMIGLFHGQPGARAFRRHLSEHMTLVSASGQTLLDAYEHVARSARAAA